MKPSRVLLVVPDLFFASRIAATAKGLGVEIEEASAPLALERWQSAAHDLAIVDLDGGGDPIGLVRALKSEPRAGRVLAFCRHTATDAIKAARAAGADQVLPRSALFPNLASILDAGGVASSGA